MRRHLAYLKYVLRHKWFVLLEGLRLKVPIWILLLHDWDKFLPDEWFPYARTFYKPDGTKQYNESPEFALAWMKHQHRNKHHWQRWLKANGIPLHQTNLLVWDRGNVQMVTKEIRVSGEWLVLVDMPDVEITIDPMPEVFSREMLADWRGAGRALGFPNTWVWYERNKDNIKLHPDTRLWIENQLFIRKHQFYVDEAGID